MLLLLTNASAEHLGKPIAINKDQILSVYSGEMMSEDGIVTIVTNIFCPPHGIWNVLESPEEIVALFNGTPLPKKAKPKSKSPVVKKSEE